MSVFEVFFCINAVVFLLKKVVRSKTYYEVLKDKSLAPKLLPAIEYETDGNSYDDNYFYQLELTIDQFDEIKIKKDDYYIYEVSY